MFRPDPRIQSLSALRHTEADPSVEIEIKRAAGLACIFASDEVVDQLAEHHATGKSTLGCDVYRAALCGEAGCLLAKYRSEMVDFDGTRARRA